MRQRRIGRFDITRAHGTVTFTTDDEGYHELVRRLRLGSLALLVLVPLVIAVVSGDEAVTLLALVLLGTVAPTADMIFTARHRLLQTPPWSLVRRTLVVLPPTEGDHRHPPTGPALVVDGVRIDAPVPPRMRITTSVLVMQQGGATTTTIRHHVDVLFRRQVVRVDTFEELEDAVELGHAVREALGLDEGAMEIGVAAPFEGTGVGMAIGAIAAVVQIFAVIAAVPWAMAADVGERPSVRMALAAVALLPFVVLVQEVAFHFSAAAMARNTADGMDVEADPVPEARRARLGAGAAFGLGALLLGAAVATAWTRAPRRDFVLGGDRFTLVEGDGAPSLLGLVPGHLVALDPATGKERWRTPVSGAVTRFEVHESVGLIPGSGGAFEVFDLRTGRIAWKAAVPTGGSSFFLKDGCVVLESVGSFHAFDQATGERCAALAWLLDPALAVQEVDDPRALQRQIDRLEKAKEANRERLQKLRSAAQAQAAPSLDSRRIRRTVGGVDYTLDTDGEQLVVAANRDGARLWSTELPAARLSRSPFAVGDGWILVAGVGLPGGKGSGRLRLIGLDAVTGKIRFVERHPVAESWSTADVTIAGGVGVVAWAQELYAVAPATGKVVWQLGGR
jgi:outer membrane protein assembly factor BamB